MIRYIDTPDFKNITTDYKGRVDLGDVQVTGGTISGITDLAIADGGTGASTAPAAIGNLLNGTSLSTATAATTDKILVQDTSDSDNLKTVTVQSVLDLYTLDWSDPVDADIIPDADSTRDLGSTGTRFASLFVDEIVVGGNVDGRDVSTDGDKLDTLSSNIDNSFKAYFSGTQSIAAATTTVITLNNETFDGDNVFDSTTNYRHTPDVAGTYMYIGNVTLASLGSGKVMQCIIRKNGTTEALVHVNNSGSTDTGGTVTTIVQMNGTTDYVDLAVYHDDVAARNLTNTAHANALAGFLIG